MSRQYLVTRNGRPHSVITLNKGESLVVPKRNAARRKRRNTQFFEDSQGYIHPIRSSKGYSKKKTTNSRKKKRRNSKAEFLRRMAAGKARAARNRRR